MTTQVIIKSSRPNHQAVRVEQINPAAGEPTAGTTYTLDDGDTCSLYVHSGVQLRVTEVPKSEVLPRDAAPSLTYGQKAVGLSFNPSNVAGVANCKDGFAAVIDQMNQVRNFSDDPEVKRMASVAITEAQSAQMWAVKALTWTS